MLDLVGNPKDRFCRVAAQMNLLYSFLPFRFEALVEREWLQAGHPFGKRCAKSAHAITKNRHESPVFLLFLDCVWQIWQQFPCSFEFTEDFLIVLFEHAYSSEYGNIRNFHASY